MNTTHPLTKDDIDAIRQADRMYAHVRPGDRSTLTAVKNLYGQKRGPFESQAREAQREIAVDAASATGSKAHFSISCGQYGRGNMAILAAMLRPGDRLVLHATTNNNGYLDAASIQRGRLENAPGDSYDRLYVDELLAAIVRTKDERDRTIASNVLISYSICPDNSARAIREGSY